ncbi:hypothetical protein Noc_0739 [Nitrosococcus oceani ATCC 19707]|uniref:Nucleotide-diphospho-sugar transferase domain-containing protein n=2 Tax=Nitrosococcus oceani TaxID=1229 RepID=Q3JD44_NITOC|nr:hypothetical protein [Nitrosococcus oceani]ABA57252.1 hypothetical protein Noc_0739 [Nitrosococcus oceani ATCC 19707]KFI20226.1 hypothetical protein IB75_03715 [Nitrosococcus oceani C-27]GEM20124.1 hypothetical protein NONS58_15310 [Nitrosococcus oceani]
MNHSFLFCIEAGYLEPQSLLLARSIRRWGGRYACCPIHAFQPRQGPPLAPTTLDGLQALGVVLHEEPLNHEHRFYPFANKIYACAWAEEMLQEEILVFCDSDTIFLGEPSAFDLNLALDAALQPVVLVGQGSTGPGHPHDDFWQQMYQIAGVKHTPYVNTMERGIPIRGYWNAGLIAVRRSAGICKQWLQIFRLLMKVNHIPPSGNINNLDQLSLAATLAQFPERIGALDYRYNYAIPRRALFHGPMGTVDLDELIHIHYHRWFNRPQFLELLTPPLGRDTPEYKWLKSFLPFHPTMDEPLHGQMGTQVSRAELRQRHGTARPRYQIKKTRKS